MTGESTGTGEAASTVHSASDHLAIVGGTVWTPFGMVENGTVYIEGERVVGIEWGAKHLPSRFEVLDATGKLVLPGLIDTHSHHRDPGFTNKEDILSATRAAAAGGVTTTVGMPNVEPPTTTVERYLDVMTRYEAKAVVDFNLNPAPTDLASVPGLARAGALGFKVFMIIDSKRSYPHMPGLGITDEGQLLEIFEAVGATGRPLMVHPHNQALMTLSERRAFMEEDRGPMAYVRAQRFYDGLVWDTAIQTLLSFQMATAARLHVLHLVTKPSIDGVRAAKGEGRSVTSEVNGFALLLGSEEIITERGARAVGRWVPDDVQDALWSGIREGIVDVFGSDHAPHTLEEKAQGGEDMWKTPTGVPQLQDYLAKLLTVGVNRGRIDLDDLVRLTSYNVAQIFGLYPKKGTIEPGSDADIVVVDPGLELELHDEDALTKGGWTPYHGDMVRGAPIHTLVRGRLVMRDRIVSTDAEGWGRQAAPSIPQT